ncbi:MAG: ABC transporter permease, partial [Chloroflexota bacterium]
MEELTLLAIVVGIVHSGIRLATPYLYAALGEMLGQRSGVLNLGVEGIMLMGAFSGFYVALTTGSPTLGIIAAFIVGGLMGLIMAFVSVTLQAEQGISGIGLYLFGLGISSLLFKTMLGGVEGVDGFSELRFCFGTAFCIGDIPVIGEIFFRHSIVVYGAYLLVPIMWYVLNKTTWGLNIRAVGQNPKAADSLGVSVAGVRYACVIIG